MIQAGHGHVIADAEHAQDAAGAAILRQQRDALGDGVARAVDRHLAALVQHAPARMRADAEDALHQLCALRAYQAAHAQDLALVQLEGCAAEAARIDGRKVLQLKDHLVGGAALAGRIQVIQLAAHHVGDDRIGGQLPGGPGADIFSVAHDGYLIGDAQDFFHLMADVYDAYALRLQIVDDAEQRLHLVLRQGGGGLIQDQHMAVIGHRLGNFHRLHLGYAQGAQLLTGVKAHAHALEQLLRLDIHFFMIDHGDKPQQLLHGIAPHKDVFRHAALGDGLQLLMHHGDAQVKRHQRILDLNLLPLVKDFALVHPVDAEQALHQRGFARAVFAHQGVNAARPELEIHVIQRFDAGERLHDALHFQTVLRHALSFLSQKFHHVKKEGALSRPPS